ncbi:hypothetical protein MSG28_014700 [Choristoneura fumiferana]|uniref:Uncharacterized protein n=1 Tax=Choristoneura fumiferana TaxID=7141 RepID=A0ACC0JSP0_CHOFU|nr:hypothetical protein MSG28_014700 [Choristoneura fumiferana]
MSSMVKETLANKFNGVSMKLPKCTGCVKTTVQALSFGEEACALQWDDDDDDDDDKLEKKNATPPNPESSHPDLPAMRLAPPHRSLLQKDMPRLPELTALALDKHKHINR